MKPGTSALTKSAACNLIALGLFAFTSPAEFWLIQFLFLLLLNELWQQAAALPAILAALFNIRRQQQPDRAVKTIIRLGSVVLLLAPPVIYAILWAFCRINGGESGMEAMQGEALRSYASIAALFMLAWAVDAPPFSIISLANEFFDPAPGAGVTDAPPPRSAQAENRQAPGLMPSTENIRRLHSELAEQHLATVERLLAQEEKILLATAPEPFTDTAALKGSVRTGWACIAAGGLAAALGLKLALQSLWGLFPAALGAFFIFAGFLLLQTPVKWKRKLRQTDFIITNRRLFIMEGDEARQFRWDPKLEFSLSMRGEAHGDIYVQEPNLLSRGIKALFGRRIKISAIETESNGKQSVNGLLNIPDAPQVHALLSSLCEPRPEPPSRTGGREPAAAATQAGDEAKPMMHLPPEYSRPQNSRLRKPLSSR